ncbi:MAG: carotenoid oxygenase family protein [Nevskiaceae bacterium]|nr:carotenoid oxygenase family protein [Nevskiaceae bacterium]
MAEQSSSDKPASTDRRGFLTAAALGGAAAALAAPGARAEVQFPTERGKFGAGGSAAMPGSPMSGNVNRSEHTLYDCEVDGKLPADLNGAFYRVGPDPQYPKPTALDYDIAFDGEGHASMFRISNGHVDYLSRWVKNERWKAQHAARRSLYGVYRNPYTDDPSVRGKSRATQNTQVWYHNGRVLAMKEDSMPAALDPHTLETLDGDYRFDGKLEGDTFTAHPKNDSHTGNLLAFGYEARGLGSSDIHVFEIDPAGRTIWSAWVKAPYTSEIHDYAITEKHVIFLVYPLAYLGDEKMREGGLHWGWDSTKDTYLGVMRRGGDGKDIQWAKGPQTMCTHVMGAWSDGNTAYVDMDGGDANQFPFFPNLHEPYDAAKATGRVRRFSFDTSKKKPGQFDMKVMYPEYTGALARQDDRYHTVPYRYGFLMGGGPEGRGWLRFDHQTGKTDLFNPGPDASASEMCFVPRRKGAAEGDGYLVGVVSRNKESGRSDLVVVDAQHMSEGAIATIKLPYRAAPQVHGFWVPGDQLPPVAGG